MNDEKLCKNERMNCMRKKLIALILAVVSIATSIPVNIYATDNTEELIRQQVLSEYQNDYMYQLMVNNNPEAADEYIDTIVEQKMINASTPSTYAYNYNHSILYCYVTHVTQSTPTNCSAATVLQTMYGLGLANTIYGSGVDAKQSTLYNMQTDPHPGIRLEESDSEPLVYEIVDYLNDNLSSNKYDYKLGSTYTLAAFSSKVGNSLYYDRPVILHAKTGSFEYYDGENLGHYLSLDYYNAISGTVRIVDCNYMVEFGGEHPNIPIEQAWRSVHDSSGRYFISAIN